MPTLTEAIFPARPCSRIHAVIINKKLVVNGNISFSYLLLFFLSPFSYPHCLSDQLKVGFTLRSNYLNVLFVEVAKNLLKN